MADSILTLNAMAGAKGQKILTNADSPYGYTGLIVGGITSNAGVLLAGKQYNKLSNSELDDYTAREFSSGGTLDVVWSVSNTITIPGGTSIIIYFG